MDLMPSHRIRMADRVHNEFALKEYADLRMPHLSKLPAIEKLIHEKAPLQASYDIARVQPPYFSEFTYTEMLGGMIISPQSTELAARMVQYALNTPIESPEFDPVKAIFNRTGKLDKYVLPKKKSVYAPIVIFTPGSNLMRDCLSRDIVSKIMFKEENAYIKPHPMTNDDTLRDFGLAFGYHRVIAPNESGMDYLFDAKKVYVTSSTEMGLYAALKDIPCGDVTAFPYESRAAYAHFYRVIDSDDIQTKKNRLVQALNSPYSGFVHPDDPNVSSKLDKYFEKAMELRSFFKPLIPELTIGEYSTALANKGKSPQMHQAVMAPSKPSPGVLPK